MSEQQEKPGVLNKLGGAVGRILKNLSSDDTSIPADPVVGEDYIEVPKGKETKGITPQGGEKPV